MRNRVNANARLINCAPGAALLGDYLYVPGEEVEATPPPEAVRRSQAAGDFLAPLLFTREGAPHEARHLTLPRGPGERAVQVCASWLVHEVPVSRWKRSRPICRCMYDAAR